MSRSVVVGIDGSARSAAAAEWAAYEAHRRGCVLRIVHVSGAPADALPYGAVSDGPLPEFVVALRDRIAAVLPGLEVRCRQLPGDPSYVLAAAGERAGLLVLGSRGLGGVAGRLVGSVGLRTAAHAHCPVVLVRADADGAADRRGGVVVGVEGGRPCDAVVGFAFEEAARRGTVLRAVEARTPDAGPYLTEVPLGQAEIRESLVAAELVRLQDVLSRWRDKFPEVATEAEVVALPAAKALAEASRTAELLVVGRRAPGYPMGVPRLGQVAHAVLHHAHAPVAVVPHS